MYAEPLTINDTSADGLVQITDTSPDQEGLRVTVRELIGTGCWSVPATRDSAMRRLAGRAVAGPVTVRQIRRWNAQGSTHVTYLVTPLSGKVN